jgi:hypothetical protein
MPQSSYIMCSCDEEELQPRKQNSSPKYQPVTDFVRTGQIPQSSYRMCSCDEEELQRRKQNSSPKYQPVTDFVRTGQLPDSNYNSCTGSRYRSHLHGPDYEKNVTADSRSKGWQLCHYCKNCLQSHHKDWRTCLRVMCSTLNTSSLHRAGN